MEDQLSDFQAIYHLKSGDLTGLDTLIEHFQLRAVRSVYLIVRDRHLAEDIVQEAFVQLVNKIHLFDETRPFAPWFLRCVINDAIKAANQQKRLVRLDDAESAKAAESLAVLTNPQPNPETQAISAETCREVWQALERLSPEQRAVIVQKYYLGYRETEMSAALQRPAGTIKWLLHTARKHLRGRLAALATTAVRKEE